MSVEKTFSPDMRERIILRRMSRAITPDGSSLFRFPLLKAPPIIDFNNTNFTEALKKVAILSSSLTISAGIGARLAGLI